MRRPSDRPGGVNVRARMTEARMNAACRRALMAAAPSCCLLSHPTIRCKGSAKADTQVPTGRQGGGVQYSQLAVILAQVTSPGRSAFRVRRPRLRRLAVQADRLGGSLASSRLRSGWAARDRPSRSCPTLRVANAMAITPRSCSRNAAFRSVDSAVSGCVLAGTGTGTTGLQTRSRPSTPRTDICCVASSIRLSRRSRSRCRTSSLRRAHSSR